MGIIYGEFIHERTDISTPEFIEDEVVTEAATKDDTPNEIRKLGQKLKELLDAKDEDINNVGDVADVVTDTIKGRDFSGDEKNLIYKTCNGLGIKIHGYSKKTPKVKMIELGTIHKLITTYKDYVLSMRFVGIKGDVKVAPMGISVKYNPKTCDMPKGVVFDAISMLSPNIHSVSSKKHSVNISALSNAIDSGFPRLVHKYAFRYSIKKNVGGSITLSTYKKIKESSAIAGALPRQDFQPDAVYIVNYSNRNTFVRDLAVCRDKMSNIFVSDGTEPKFVSLLDFKEMADDIKVYQCILDVSFDRIVRVSKTGLDFYKNTVQDESVTMESLDSDYRFNQVTSFIDELKSIEECVINSAPKSGIVHEVYCPVIPLVNLNEEGSVVHFFRDIDGVFAQNIDTLHRSASYKSVEDIPKTTLNILRNI